MAFDGKSRRIVNNGTSINIENPVVDVTDSFKKIFKKTTVDLKNKSIDTYIGSSLKISKYTPQTNIKTRINKLKGENKEVSINEEMVKLLNKAGVYGLHKNTPLSHTAMHGFTFKYQQQKGQRSSTAESMAKAWSKIKTMENSKNGRLYVFDLETFGGKTKDLRWSPQGITEFAMQTHDFATGKRNTTNILMTNDNVISGLDSFLTEYEDLMSKISIDEIKKNHNDVYVTAMRMSLYDPERGAKFELKDNIWQATQLIDSENAVAGNIDAVTRGVKQFKYMNKTLKENNAYINPDTGLPYDISALIKATSQMSLDMANNTGVVGGHNIINFDRPILDKDIRNIYNSLSDIINNSESTKDQIEQAKKGMDYIKKSFGDNIGFNFDKGNVLDTFPIVTLAANEYGFESPNYQLSTLAKKYYPEEAAKGTAHLGVHDTKMNLSLILDPSEELDGKSLMSYLMEKDISDFNINNPAIELNNKQLFKAVGNVQSSNFSGKSYINYRRYSNGDIYTNGGFVISNGEISHTKYAGNTGLNKNGFYTLSGQGIININDLDNDIVKQLREAYPELNTDTLYHAAFSSHTRTTYANPHTVHIFASTQEELEGIIGSNLVHVANITDNGYDLIEKNKQYVTNMTYNTKTKKITAPSSTDSTEIILNAMEFSEKQAVNDAANRSVFNHEKSLKKIHGLLSFDEEARKKGFEEGLDKMKADGVTLSTILKKGDGTVDIVGHDGALEQVRYFTPEKTEELKEIYRRHMGFNIKGTDEYNIDFRTLTNTSAVYEIVESKKEYYKNLIKVTEDHFGKNMKYDDVDANYFFKELDRKVSVEVMKNIGIDDDETIIRAVRGMSNTSTHEYSYFANRYDFTLGNKFMRLGEKAQPIENIFGFSSDINTVTYDMSKINPNSDFINKLYNLRMGDKANSSLSENEIESYKKQAVYEFLIDQYGKKDNSLLFENKKLNEYAEKVITHSTLTGKAPDDFDTNIAVTLIGEAIKETKSKKITAGIHDIMGDLDILTVKPNAADFFNSTKLENIVNISKDIKDIHTYSEKDRKFLVNNLVQIFGLDDDTFERGLETLDPVEVKTAKLIRKVTHEQLESQLDDMVRTMDRHNITLHVDRLNKQMFIEKNGLVQELTGMPHLDMDDDGNITITSGSNKLAVGLRLKVHETKDGKRTYISTNLDSDFGRKNFFYDMFEDRFRTNNGQIQLSDMNRYIKYHNKETSEYTKYSGMKTDLFTVNNRVNISEAHELYYDMIRKDGPLSYLLENVDTSNKDLIQQLRNKQSRLHTDSKLDSNGIPPDLFMLAANDDLALALATLDPNDPHYKEFMELSNYIGASLKETAYVKGELQIGHRVVGNITNIWDNPSRPPMTGAGNIKYLKVEDIGELRKYGVEPGSMLESNKTLKGIYREKENMLLTSDFRSRQIYLSAPEIKKRMEKQRASILESKAKINNRTINQMTDEYLNEVYDHLVETLSSGTYEQSRIGDARVFDNIINMPVDVQYLSVNKDVMNAIDRKTDKSKIQRLLNVVGSIDINEDGEYVYKRRSGTMIKKGDTVAEYVGYGNIKQSFGSKHDKGVLYFSVSTNKQELTDEHISKIINQYANQFDELNTQEDKLNKLFEILDAKGLKATFKIENANQASLFKIQDAGVEKGMTYAPNVQLGRLNKDVKAYFTELQKENPDNKMITAFLNGMIPNDRAIKALHEDIADTKGITVKELIESTSGSAFTSIKEILDLVKDEREALSEISFGEYGAFNGFVSVANDNIAGHDNVGLNVFGIFGEAVRKYSEISGKSYQEAALEIGSTMQQNDDLNFIRQTMHDANGKINKDKGRAFKIDDVGTFILDDIHEEKSFIDKAKLNNTLEYVNDLIVKLDSNADENLKLVHENVYSRDEDGNLIHHEKIIGSFDFERKDGKNVITGSTLYVNHSIIEDSETVSSVSQEFINAKKALNEYAKIDPEKLTAEDKDKIKKLQEVVSSQQDHVKFIKADDQMLSILENKRFNDDMSEDLKSSLLIESGKERNFNKEKAEFLSKKSGGYIIFDKDTGEFAINEEIKNTGAYDAFIKQIKSRQYYNDVFADELTADMLKDEKYAHLSGIYNDIIGTGKANKIGVHNAQNIYDLQGMAMSAEFNREAFDKDHMEELIKNHNFELINIKDYVPTEGAGNGGTIDSIRDKRIILDLGEHFTDNQRYVAIPAGGQQIGDMEALSKMQGMVKELKRHSNRLEDLEIGSLDGVNIDVYNELSDKIQKGILNNSKVSPTVRKKYEKELNAMQDVRDRMIELSDRYNRKDTLYTTTSKVEIMEASRRAKIMSITSADIIDKDLEAIGIKNISVSSTGAEFMKKAKVLMEDGTEESLYNLSKQGIHYDFERVGIDHFINAGLFDSSGEATPETLKKFGMKDTQELVNHLQTYGSADIVMRYPLIAENSMYATRVYLDREFDGKNIKSVSSYSMLKYIGDSDGDSESAFQANLNDVSFALYEYQRKRAAAEVKASNKTLTGVDLQEAIKENVLSKGVISKEEYEGFYKLSLGMDNTAVIENAQWVNKVEKGILEDMVKNKQVGSIESIGSLIKDPTSETFKNYRYESIHIHPSSELISSNMKEVKAAVSKALETNAESFEGNTLDLAKKITEGSLHMNDIKGTDKYSVLDFAMKALESDKEFTKTNEFAQMQQALIERVGIQQAFEEEGSKSAKAAIGSINNLLSSLKIVGTKAFGDESSNLYDPNKARLVNSGFYKMEQQVISFKKIAPEIGDSRLVELEDIMSVAKSGKAGRVQKEQLAEWIGTYIPKKDTESIWDNMRPSVRMKEEGEKGFISSFILSQRKLENNTLSDEELVIKAKNRYIAEELIDSVNAMANDKSWSRALIDISGSGKKTSMGKTIDRNNYTSPNEFMTTQVNNTIKDRKTIPDINSFVTEDKIGDELLDLTDSIDAFNTLSEQSGLKPHVNNKMLNNVSSLSLGTGIGMAALGVAAGLMVAGYAGGGHQKPTKPQDDSQPVEVTPMLDDGNGDTGMRQQGYIINIKADTNKGARHLKRTLKDVAKASNNNGDVTINMNYRTTSGGGYSNKDIENIINNFM